MKAAHIIVNYLAHRSRIALVASLVAGVAVSSMPIVSDAHGESLSPAAVNETWVCSGAGPSFTQGASTMRFLSKDDLLFEQSAAMTRYRILAHNDYSIIAEDHYGDFDPVLGAVGIFVSTVMIDKTTGDFTYTMSASGRTPEHRAGHCDKFEEQRIPTEDVIAQRKR